MFTSLIFKIFMPEMGNKPDHIQRTRCGVISGIVGIVCNFILVIVKLVLAVLSGSIAVAADAVNNLSDMGSGIITAVGFRLSGSPADAKHPFGHGRIEYVAGLIVSLLIVGLGLCFLKDSVISVFQTRKIHSDTLTIIIFTSTILIKCWLFCFYWKVAKMLNSDVIKASAYDSLSDCLGTFIVVGALISSRYTDFPVDGCAGIVVALMILWAGGNVLKDIVSKLLGEPPNSEMVEKVKTALLECPGIDGVHCIAIHNYGENSFYVTAHAEISDKGDRLSAHDILEKAEIAVGKKLPVHLLLHGDPYSKTDPEIILWRSRLENVLSFFDTDLKLYDFRVGKNPEGHVKNLSFHILMPLEHNVTEDGISQRLHDNMEKFDPEIVLEITFIKSLV